MESAQRGDDDLTTLEKVVTSDLLNPKSTGFEALPRSTNMTSIKCNYLFYC